METFVEWRLLMCCASESACFRSASDTPLADAEYLAAMRAVVLPLIKAFRLFCHHLLLIIRPKNSQAILDPGVSRV